VQLLVSRLLCEPLACCCLHRNSIFACGLAVNGSQLSPARHTLLMHAQGSVT